MWNYREKDNSSFSSKKTKRTILLSGITFLVYAHFFMGSNGVRNPYGLLDNWIFSVLYWFVYLIIWCKIG